LDISLPDASTHLLRALDTMQLPRVLGVVHCAGVLEDSLVLETSRDSFRRVMAPKVKGALTLHEAFPPGSVDFFVLYSSIGQLVGTAGQASYGAGNAFLDAMAFHRRAQGDNTVAMQFTAWRGSGMATSTDFLTVELESKGITDISSDEAFRAWEHLSKFDIGSAVVTRCLAIDEGSPVAVPILEDIVVRRPRAQVNGHSQEEKAKTSRSVSATDNARPTDPDGLRQWLEVSIRQCIAAVLMMPDIAEIDGGTMVNDLGIDSVMTVALRRQFQDFFKIKVPPTLTWKHPTVDSMVPWFAAKLQEE
jgi:6-methylsalicylic acid synthase